MVNDSIKNKAKALVAKSKEKRLIKTYDEFRKTPTSKEHALSSEEVNYYTSRRKGDAK